MHIISRSVNEGLVIGDDIVVTVLEIQDGYVRIGIETPNRPPYYREEVLYCGDNDGDMFEECDEAQSELEPAVMSVAF
jgi:carbon storage regulator CsrA